MTLQRPSGPWSRRSQPTALPSSKFHSITNGGRCRNCDDGRAVGCDRLLHGPLGLCSVMATVEIEEAEKLVGERAGVVVWRLFYERFETGHSLIERGCGFCVIVVNLPVSISVLQGRQTGALDLPRRIRGRLRLRRQRTQYGFAGLGVDFERREEAQQRQHNPEPSQLSPRIPWRLFIVLAPPVVLGHPLQGGNLSCCNRVSGQAPNRRASPARDNETWRSPNWA